MRINNALTAAMRPSSPGETCSPPASQDLQATDLLTTMNRQKAPCKPEGHRFKFIPQPDITMAYFRAAVIGEHVSIPGVIESAVRFRPNPAAHCYVSRRR